MQPHWYEIHLHRTVQLVKHRVQDLEHEVQDLQYLPELVDNMRDDLKYLSDKMTSDKTTSDKTTSDKTTSDKTTSDKTTSANTIPTADNTISTAKIEEIAEEIVRKRLQEVTHKMVEEQRSQGKAVAEYLQEQMASAGMFIHIIHRQMRSSKFLTYQQARYSSLGFSSFPCCRREQRHPVSLVLYLEAFC
jgi:cytoskeletal protein RodZ